MEECSLPCSLILKSSYYKLIHLFIIKILVNPVPAVPRDKLASGSVHALLRCTSAAAKHTSVNRTWTVRRCKRTAARESLVIQPSGSAPEWKAVPRPQLQRRVSSSSVGTMCRCCGGEWCVSLYTAALQPYPSIQTSPSWTDRLSGPGRRRHVCCGGRAGTRETQSTQSPVCGVTAISALFSHGGVHDRPGHHDHSRRGRRRRDGGHRQQ